MPDNHTCIYCQNTKEETGFTKDHVLPKCFGSFEPEGFTLINTVCSDCNQFFGDTLELHLGRDTLEGIARYRYEIFPGGKPKHRRLIFKIERPGLLFGLLVSPKPQLLEGLPEIELLDQVGFFNVKTNTYDYFPTTDIPKSEQLEVGGYNFQDNEIRMIGDYEILRKELAELGYPNRFLREEPLFMTPQDKRNILVLIKSRIDRTVARGMAKIAFNYLAHATSNAFVLGRDFDTIRKFIRYNEGAFDEIFRADNVPILRKERQLGKRILDGHIITVDWQGEDLVCLLAIFNSLVQITYHFWLSRRYSGIWIPVCCGHYFDVAQGSIRTIFNIKKLITFD